MHAFMLPIIVHTKTTTSNLYSTITVYKIHNITANLKSNATPKIIIQQLKNINCYHTLKLDIHML